MPSEKCLTEHDIDRFVQSVLPVMRLAVFSRVGMMDAATAIQCLALVRPEEVLPDLMEKWVWSGVWLVLVPPTTGPMLLWRHSLSLIK